MTLAESSISLLDFDRPLPFASIASIKRYGGSSRASLTKSQTAIVSCARPQPWQRRVAFFHEISGNPACSMKKQIARISIWQSSKIMTAFYCLLGFIYTLIGIPMLVFGGDRLRIVGIFYLFGPIFFAVIGFVFFAVSAAIYNVLAKRLGGVEFEELAVEETPDPQTETQSV
jgi:hypothetical protein